MNLKEREKLPTNQRLSFLELYVELIIDKLLNEGLSLGYVPSLDKFIGWEIKNPTNREDSKEDNDD